VYKNPKTKKKTSFLKKNKRGIYLSIYPSAKYRKKTKQHPSLQKFHQKATLAENKKNGAPLYGGAPFFKKKTINYITTTVIYDLS
jgi:hypothetical protein